MSNLNFEPNPRIHIEVKYLRRARRLTIRVLDSSIVRVTAPLRTKISDIQNMLNVHSEWILKKYKMIEDRPVQNKIKFVTGEVLPFYGERFILKIIDGKGAVTRFENELVVPVQLKITAIDNNVEIEKYIQKLLVKWYQQEALEKIKSRVQFFTEQLQTSAKTISLKNYKSRWGACSAKGDLIFNWQIITFEKHLFDYVVAHEFCHLKEMNHGPKFYGLLQHLGFRKSETHKQMKNVRNLF